MARVANRSWYSWSDSVTGLVVCDCYRHRIIDTELVKVVTHSNARALEHPNHDSTVPVCRECYEWIREKENDVMTPYADARSYADFQNEEGG
jgi:hypothetical protein